MEQNLFWFRVTRYDCPKINPANSLGSGFSRKCLCCHLSCLLTLNFRYYDILEERVPSALIEEYHSLVSQCEELYRQFLDLRNRLSGSDSDSEAENVSVVEGMKLYDKIEHLKQKLKLIENPLLRYPKGV